MNDNHKENPMATPNTDALVAGAKQWITDMTDDEFDAVVAEVRKPAATVADGRDRFAAKQVQ